VIVEVLANDEPNSHIAARALGQLGVHAKPAVNALAEALGHESWLTRASAAHALGNIGPEAQAAGSALRGTLQDQVPQVRLAGACAIWTIERSEEAITVLTLLLNCDDLSLRFGAIEALGDIGPPAIAALPALKELSHEQTKTPPATDNTANELDSLFSGMPDWNPHKGITTVAATWAVGRISEAEDLLEQLLPELENEDRWRRCGAAWALGKMGPDATAAIPGIRRLLEDPVEYGYFALQIRWALSQIAPEEFGRGDQQ
jgi:HEAT repeat protein